MGDTNIIKQCFEYAKKAVGDIYGITPSGEKTSGIGAIMSVCMDSGGINNYQQRVTRADEISCSEYADKEATKYFKSNMLSGDMVAFGTLKGKFFSECVNVNGVANARPHSGLPAIAPKCDIAKN